MELTDWTHSYVKMRDAMRRTLLEHSMQGEVLTCKHKNKVHHYLISDSLLVPQAKDWFTVVCLQTPENVKFLVDHWSDFLQDKLTILFVHPAQNVYWQINPSMHNKIADPETLQQGIETMASEVPYV